VYVVRVGAVVVDVCVVVGCVDVCVVIIVVAIVSVVDNAVTTTCSFDVVVGGVDVVDGGGVGVVGVLCDAVIVADAGYDVAVVVVGIRCAAIARAVLRTADYTLQCVFFYICARMQ